jgi:integrase
MGGLDTVPGAPRHDDCSPRVVEPVCGLGAGLMGRPATGTVVRPTPEQPCFALRFRAYGKREYMTLGRPEDGWTEQMAERELAVVLRDVDLRTWRRPQKDPAPAPAEDPGFLQFAAEWFAAKELEIEKNTARSYQNDLRKHLLPFFKDHALSQITVKEIDRYRRQKVRESAQATARVEAGKPRMVEIVDPRGRSYLRPERPLSINMHIDLLSQILALAKDHDHILSNPALGKRRRLKVTKKRPVFLDSAEHVAVLLEAAADLDARDQVVIVKDPRGRSYTQRRHNQTTGRRAAIAILLLGGPRVSAGGALLERDLDLANGRFDVGRDKTEAGMREVDTLPLLREILIEHRQQKIREGLPTGPDDPVLITSKGNARDRHNLRKDIVAPVVRRAEELLAERGAQPLPLGITPHKLRHTFASILVAIGKDPTYVMHQLGHTDPAFTLRVYAHMMRRSEVERERLKALVEGRVWAVYLRFGRSGGPDEQRLNDEKPRVSRAFRSSGRPDLNRGPHRPERCALPGCATPRCLLSIP